MTQNMRKHGNFWRCQMCGAEFMLLTTLVRHETGELEDFRDLGRILQEEYAESRKTWRGVYVSQFPYVVKGR